MEKNDSLIDFQTIGGGNKALGVIVSELSTIEEKMLRNVQTGVRKRKGHIRTVFFHSNCLKVQLPD